MLAIERELPAIISAYNEWVGGVNDDTQGYHETITQASLRMAHRALGDAPLHVVLAELMAGPCGRSDWIFAHWSKDVLFSVDARRGWVAPDIAPLPVG